VELGIRGPRRKGWPAVPAGRAVGEVARVREDDDHQERSRGGEAGWLATRSSSVVTGVSPSSGRPEIDDGQRSTAAGDRQRGLADGLNLDGSKASAAPSRRRPKQGPRPSRQAAVDGQSQAGGASVHRAVGMRASG
jgi:hypothetical protein